MIAKVTLIFIDETMTQNGSDSIFKNIPQEVIYIFGGFIDVSSLFLLTTLLPALLAIKYRGNNFEITMAGTLIAVNLVFSFIFGTIIQIALDPWADYDIDYPSSDNYKRILFCSLLVCSNIPYLEWAHLEW